MNESDLVRTAKLCVSVINEELEFPNHDMDKNRIKLAVILLKAKIDDWEYQHGESINL